MKNLFTPILILFFLLNVACSKDSIVESTENQAEIDQEQAKGSGSNGGEAGIVCLVCIHKTYINQNMCDNGDGTFTVNEITRDFPDNVDFDRLIANMAATGFTCE